MFGRDVKLGAGHFNASSENEFILTPTSETFQNVDLSLAKLSLAQTCTNYIRCRFNSILVTECYKSYGSCCFLAIICSSGWPPSSFKLLIQWIAMDCRYLVVPDFQGGFREM